jgi:hypothetical protein
MGADEVGSARVVTTPMPGHALSGYQVLDEVEAATVGVRFAR